MADSRLKEMVILDFLEKMFHLFRILEDLKILQYEKSFQKRYQTGSVRSLL